MKFCNFVLLVYLVVTIHNNDTSYTHDIMDDSALHSEVSFTFERGN